MRIDRDMPNAGRAPLRPLASAGQPATGSGGSFAMGDISRRTLLRAGVVAAVAVPLSSLLLPTDAAFASTLNRSSFSPYKGTRFALTAPSDGTVLTLAAIEDLPNAPRGDQ